jgi:glycosyltransferase involved in cell wall biosynthesis
MPVSETPSRTEISSGRVPFRVLWQNEHYPDPVKGGGGAINTYYIVKELAGLGCDPLILAQGDKNGGGREEDVGGTRVLRVSPRRPPDALWPIWPVLSAAYLRQTLTGITRQFAGFVCIDAPYALSLKRLHPNRPLVCRIEGTAKGYRAAISDDCPPITTLADRRVDFLRRFLFWQNDLCDRLAWRRSDALVVKSQFMRDDVTRLYGIRPEKIHVIPNGVDHERYASARPSPRTLEDMGNADRNKIVITYCGRLVKMKNLSFLLQAYATMRLRKRCVVVLVGEGDQRAPLANEARSLGIGAGVRFVGHTTRVEEYLAASDVFVLPSTYEPFGNALLEAMAAGLPCLALRPDGLTVRTASAEIIADGVSGYLVDGRDPNDLAAKLDLLCREPSLRLRLGQAGRRIAAERFSWRRCAEAYLELLYSSAARLQSTHP